MTGERSLQYRNSVIHYEVTGHGPGIVICFHGYGEDCRSFEFLSKHAGDLFTFIAIDLPFHGQTQWNEGLSFTVDDLENILSPILADNNVPAIARITLLGFSLGGRVALSLYEQIADRVGRLVLLAPDGLKVNSWYWLATQSWAGNKIFAFTMKHPGWFFGMLKTLNRLKLVNASIFKFVNYYIGDEKVRDLLYKRWTGLRLLKPHLEKIRSQIRAHYIPVRLVYGKHDRIILSSVGKRFIRGIEDKATISVIHSGHQVLHEKHMAELMPALVS